MSETGMNPLRQPAEEAPSQPRTVRITAGWRHAVLSGIGALLGILIAFGIDAWWGNRQDAIREGSYLVAVRAELAATREGLEAHMKSRSDAIVAMKRQIATVAAASPGAGSADSVTVLLVEIAPYYDFAPHRAVLNEMLAAGGLQLIRSAELRRSIAAYEQALALDRSTQDDALAFWRLQMSPYLMLYANWPATTRINPRVEDDIKPEPVIYPFQADPSAFFGNRTYANLLMSRILTERRVRLRQQDVLARIDALLILLDSDR